MDPKTMADKIRQIIKRKPQCRENKRSLVANYLWLEANSKGADPRKVTLHWWLMQYADEKSFVSEIESIGRIHREVIRQLDEEQGIIHDFKTDQQEQVKTDIENL